MIVKLKFGTIEGYYKISHNSSEQLQAEDVSGFSDTSSFELQGEEKEIKEGLLHSLAWDDVTVNLPKGKVELFPGLGIFFGTSGSGKTRLVNYIIHQLAQRASTRVSKIAFNEPDLIISDGSIATVSEDQLLEMVASFLASDADILFIDSIRTFIYSSKSGATGKGGIDMTMYTKLTELSILAQKFGKSINVVFNPISADKQVVDNVKEAVKGSIETLYFIDQVSGTLSVESRNHRAKREKITISYDPAKVSTTKEGALTSREDAIEFVATMTEGISGPLSGLVGRKLRDSYGNFGS
jgi:ABC-type dipeptide/oligopeptide/nickel transport system ATPase component